ncbi:hypothetical protein FRX31_007967 [Thalictrum thalictroides]|uniref:Uncharacterized protein n=1 Tax=Thalictrum thalictroides TaxID=46969 RepID=A0A7J6X0A1_THATH|nr:hypothetical protein FRX31_007967 [Thalictrum thalictroides]
METQKQFAYKRPKEDIKTVRQQQKELRRIRQKARRQSMTEAQMQQRREQGRMYYLKKKGKLVTTQTEIKDVPSDQPRSETNVHLAENNMVNACTTAEQLQTWKEHEHEYQCQGRVSLEDQERVKHTEQMNVTMNPQTEVHIVESIELNMPNPPKSRLSHVRRLARNLNKQTVGGNKVVRPARLIHVRRQARMLHSQVDRSDEEGIHIKKLGNSRNRDTSTSLMQEHAQILLDISRMNRHTSIPSRESMEKILNGADDFHEVSADKDVDSDEDSGESISDSEEVLAFLRGLSARKGQFIEH